MAKLNLNSDKLNENEPLNKRLKTMKLDGDKNVAKNQIKNQEDKNVKSIDNQSKKKAKSPLNKQPKIDKSSKLQAKDQSKSDELRKKRQMRRQKKKLVKLNKKSVLKSKDKNQVKNEDEQKNLNSNQRLASIFKQENENSKTILNHYKNLASKLNDNQLDEFVQQIKLLISDDCLDRELRLYLINDLNRFISKLISQQSAKDTLFNLIKFCALNSFFATRQDSIKNKDEAMINCIRNCFIKTIIVILRNSINKKKKEVDKTKLDLLYQIMKYVYNLNNNEGAKEEEAKADVKDDFNQIFKKISNSYKQIQLKDEDKQNQSILSAFFFFYIYLSVNVFEDQANCMRILEEINECFKRFTNKSKDEDLHWADVFTDIILSLLSTANNFKRAISDEVFGLISKEITKTGLGNFDFFFNC